MRYPGIISSLLNTGVKTALQDAAGFAQILPLGRGGGRARWSIGHKPRLTVATPDCWSLPQDRIPWWPNTSDASTLPSNRYPISSLQSRDRVGKARDQSCIGVVWANKLKHHRIAVQSLQIEGAR